MNSDLQNCMQNGVSRRSFLRTLGAASAAAAAERVGAEAANRTDVERSDLP